jgi:hypothetical protein
LFKSLFPSALQVACLKQTVDDILYFKHLRKNYKKILYLFAKYKEHSSKQSIESISHSRLIINKLFKHYQSTELTASNKNLILNPIDVSYLRLFIGQRLNVVSYPRIKFFFSYVRVDKRIKLIKINISNALNPDAQ